MILYHHVITLSTKRKSTWIMQFQKVFCWKPASWRDIHHHVPPPKNVPTNVWVMQGLWPTLFENAWVKLNIRALIFKYFVDKWSASFFCKRQNSKCFRLWRPYSLCHSIATLPEYCKSSHRIPRRTVRLCFYMKTDGGPRWPIGHSLPNLALDHVFVLLG